MNKSVIEIKRMEREFNVHNSWVLPKEIDVCIQLINWSKRKGNENKQIHSHSVEWKAGELKNPPEYIEEIPYIPPARWLCDYICYLTIYWQEV